ncbi:MAG: hypothetical protein P4L84_32325 [Isosphaeraceae bacterium]|nr:hypothetical protein [Isosphaeraceae bacterium]
MSSAMMMDRAGLATPGMTTAGAGTMTAPGSVPTGMNMMMVPRCTVRMEKCDGGMKIVCTCDDTMSAGMMQNLCTMLAGGMCSCCAVMNGMVACCCNLMMGMCRCEMMDNGVRITCTSGDKACCAMIQACCDNMTAMMKAGCICCVMLGNMPVCCSC